MVVTALPGPWAAIDEVPPVLQTSDIDVHFGGVSALDGVTVGFHASETCGIMGPNGAGKSTLFDVLSGIRSPTSGTVFLGEEAITRRSAVRRARMGLRRTFQRQQTFGWLSVEDNLMVALESAGGGGGLIADLVRLPTRTRVEDQRRRRVEEVLETCGLSSVAEVPAGNLDIGRARTVELARAIVQNPRVLLLDEPTSGLEDRQAAELGRVVELLRQRGCAVALVEHDVGFMFEHCQRIVVLNLGRVLAEGTPEEIRADPDVSTAYLGAM